MIKNWALRFLIGLTGLLTVAVVFAWAGLPVLIQSQAPKYLMERTQHVLTLDKPSINPLNLRVQLGKIQLTTPAGENLLDLESLDLKLSWAALLKGEVQIDHLLCSGLGVSFALLQDKGSNWQPLIDGFASAPEPQEEPTSKPPVLTLTKLALTNSRLNFEDRRTPEGLKTVLDPINIELNDLSTRAGHNGQFELNAKSNQGEELLLTANLDPATPAVKGKLNLSGLNLANYAMALPASVPYKDPEGVIGVGLDFSASMPESGLIYEVSNGRLQMEHLGLKSDGGNSPEIAKIKLLALENIAFASPQEIAQVENLKLEGLELGSEGGSKTPVHLDRLTIGPVQVDLPGQHASVASVLVTGLSAQVKRLEDGQFELEQALSKWVPPNEPVSTKVDAINTADGQVAQKDAQGGEAAPASWTYKINSIELQNSEVGYADASFNPALDYTVTLKEAKTQGVSNNLNAELPISAKLQLNNGGDLALSGSLTPASGTGQFDLTLQGLAVAHAQPFITPFALLDVASGTVHAQGKLTLDGSNVTYLGQAGVDSLRLNQRGTNTPFFQLTHLNLDDIKGGTLGLTIKQVRVEGLDTRVAIAKDKSTNIDRILVKRAEQKKEKPQASKGDAPAYPFAIDKVVVADSQLDFEDLSLILPFGTRIQKLNATVTGLDSKPGTKGQIKLAGLVNRDGSAQGEGTVNFMDPTDYLDLNLRFKNVDMARLTPYTATFANRKIDGGKLSMYLSYNIQRRALNSNNQVIVEKLKLGEKVQSPEAIDLPLELAVALLEDSNGVIDLGLPIRGSLDEPGFDIGELIFKTLTNLITKAVAAPFKLLGGLLGASGGSDGQINQVGFTAGDVGLNAGDQTRIEQMATALRQRPALKLTVQGFWTESDRIALKDRITRLKVYRHMGETVEKLQPPPLDLRSNAVKQALRKVFVEERGEDRYRSLEAAYRSINPQGLDEGIFDRAVAGMTGIVDPAKPLSADEKERLQGRSFEAVLYQELNDEQPVSDNLAAGLAESRAKAVVDQLESLGIDSSRVQVNPASKVDAPEGQTVPVGLELGV